jgi:hypothetical protein
MVKTKQFYKNIGKKGEQAKMAKGFAWMDPARSREANRRRWAAVRANPGPPPERRGRLGPVLDFRDHK